MIWSASGATAEGLILPNCKEPFTFCLLCCLPKTLQQLSRVAGRGLIFLPERPAEGRIISESAFIAGFCCRHPVLNQGFGQQKPFFIDIGADGIAGFRLEQVHEVGTAQEKLFRKAIHRDFFREMIVDVIDDGSNFMIAHLVFQIVHPVVKKRPV